ncbi:hypothetical protein HDU84_007355, partial [Entophlyctis sp. JEL0112]
MTACVDIDSDGLLMFATTQARIPVSLDRKSITLNAACEEELAIPIQPFDFQGLCRVRVVELPIPKRHDPFAVGVIFTFSHVAFDGTAGSSIVFEWLNALFDGPDKALNRQDSKSQTLTTMLPASENSLPKLFSFCLSVLQLLWFLYVHRPVTLEFPTGLTDKDLFETSLCDEARHSQLTRFRTHFFTESESAAIIARAKSLN